MGKTLKAYALFLYGYLALALMGVFSLEMAVAMIHVVIMMLPLGAFSHTVRGEENGGRVMVRARYCLVLLAALVSGAAGLLGSVFLSVTGAWRGHLNVVLISLGTGLLVADFALPLCCKQGQGKGRPWLYVMVFLPVAALFGLVRLGLMKEGGPGSTLPVQPPRVLGCCLLLALAGLGVSFRISCRAAEQGGHINKKNASF